MTLESSSSSITVGTNNAMLLRSQGKVMFLHLSVCWEGHAIRFLLLNLPTQMEMSEHVHQLTRQHTSTFICRSIILSHYDEQCMLLKYSTGTRACLFREVQRRVKSVVVWGVFIKGWIAYLLSIRKICKSKLFAKKG